jgi:hypothetical protein
MGRTPRVTRIGENTQGVFSDVLERRLPNGWTFGLPNEVYRTAEGAAFDGLGVPPDIAVPVFADGDVVAGRDPVIEKAIPLRRVHEEDYARERLVNPLDELRRPESDRSLSKVISKIESQTSARPISGNLPPLWKATATPAGAHIEKLHGRTRPPGMVSYERYEASSIEDAAARTQIERATGAVEEALTRGTLH